MSLFFPSLDLALKKASQPAKRVWWERYMKGVVPFLGVPLPKIRSILQKLYHEYRIHDWNWQQKADLASQLMQHKHTEYKLSAILMYQLWFIDHMDADILLYHLEKFYQKQWIWDWNTADWLSVRVLTPLVKNHETTAFQHLDEWIKHPYVWKARSALVALCQIDDISRYRQKVFAYSRILLPREERFAKTAAGWALREYYKKDKDSVIHFLTEQKPHLSTEVFNNACKYMDKEEKKALKASLKPSSYRGTE